MGTHRLADDFARSVRKRLDVPPDASPRAIARAAWGPRPCVLSPGTARIVVDGDSRCLHQDPATPAHVRNWTLSRALSAHLLARDGVDIPIAAVASSLLLPESAMQRERAETSESIASRYVAPLGVVLLRVADLEQRPTAIVLPHWSRVAGNACGALPIDHPTLRELAFGRVGLLRLRRTRTPDGEIALRVA